MKININNFSSETLFDKVYYNEDISKINENYLNVDVEAIKTLWNSQR